MILSKAQRVLLSSSLSMFLVGCGAPNYSQSDMHMTVEESESTQAKAPEKVPALVKASPTAPMLSESEDSPTFDVVVTSVSVRDLLFALARDAGVNMDIDDNVGGLVTISALDQTLDAILERIGKQVAIRVETVGDAILVKVDSPYHKYYQVDFLNVTRSYSSSASAGGVGDTGSSSVSNSGGSDFWTSLETSLAGILQISYEEGESAAVVERTLRGAAQGEAAAAADATEYKASAGENSYDLNPDTGVLLVYAPERLHKQVQELLDRNMEILHRQVLLEATIVEVVLNNSYAQGIDWSVFNSLAEEGLALYQGAGVGGAVAALEFITEELSVQLAESTISGQNYANATVAQLQALGFSSTQANSIVNTYAAGADRGNAIASQIAGNRLDAFEARVLSREHAKVKEQEFTSTESDPDDNGFRTYTTSGNVTLLQVNQEATRRTSGGLKPNNTSPNSFFTAAYRQGDISAAVQLLDTFGDAKVLSSPRISVLNHQPALLRVVDQEVYFSFDVQENIDEESGQATSRTISASEETVDVGFSMNVFPHISDSGEIILNLKPAVARVIDYRQAPILDSFGSSAGGTQNYVPITRVRELESLISLRDGEIAVLGGLLEDRTGDSSHSVPGLSRLPGIGKLFERKDESTQRTEFVVFIRARIISNPSVNGDYSGYRHLLPDGDFIVRDTESTLLPPSQLKTR